MRRRAFSFEHLKQKIDNLSRMNPQNRIWIPIVALLVGLAIGRFSVSTKTVTSDADAKRSAAADRKEASVSAETFSQRKSVRSEPETDKAEDIYSEIKGSLTANGTARLYDSFGKFSHLI